MPSLRVFRDQLSVTWSTLLVFAGLTYRSENLRAVGWMSSGLSCSSPALLCLLLGPAGKDRIDPVMAVGDRGACGQSLTHRPWFKALLASSLVSTPSAKPRDVIEAIIWGSWKVTLPLPGQPA